MSKQVEVSASILSADFSRLAEVLEMSERAGAERFHIDVMDGHFVPNITIGPVVLKAIRKNTKCALEAHLMIEHPWDYINDFVDAGADTIGLHAECYGQRRVGSNYGEYPKEVDTIDVERALKDIQKIKSQGVEACFVLNPGTPVTCLDPILKELDSVLIMSVNPGFSGQKFMPEVLPKLEYVRAKFSGDIAIDGGVNQDSAASVVKAGANILITASYFYGSDDPKSVVQYLKSLV